MVYETRKVKMTRIDIDKLKKRNVDNFINQVQDYEEIDYNVLVPTELGEQVKNSALKVIDGNKSSEVYEKVDADSGIQNSLILEHNNSQNDDLSIPVTIEKLDETDGIPFTLDIIPIEALYLMSDGSYLKKVDKNKYAVGIDVSTYQGDINWEQAKEKIDFAILRVGITTQDGNMYVDDKFIKNIEECNRLGIPVGVYYYSNALDKETNAKEIDLVLSTLKGYNIQLPIYRDLEGNCQNDLLNGESGRLRQEELSLDFCESMDEAGYVGGLYIHNKYSNLVPNVSDKHPVWCCGSLYYNSTSNDYSLDFDDMVYGYNYDDNGNMQPEKLDELVSMYQPSCEGKGSSLGINTGFVDLDYMDREYFNNLLNSIYISDSN